MHTTSLFRHFMITVGISVAVYLFMTFLLPYLFPFLLAYILMRMLWPVMEYLHNVCKFPRFFSHYGTLILFFGGIVLSLARLFTSYIHRSGCCSPIYLLINRLQFPFSKHVVLLLAAALIIISTYILARQRLFYTSKWL